MSSSLLERVSPNALSFDFPLFEDPKPHEKEVERDVDGRGGAGLEEDGASYVATRSALSGGATTFRLLKDGMRLMVQQE